MSLTVNYATVSLVQNSWQEVKNIPDCTQVAGELLFRKIFEIAPGAWKLFPFGKGFETADDEMFQSAGFRSHAKNVVSMLDTAVSFLGPDLDVLADTLVDLGAKHVSYGVLPEHYPIVGQALLATLATALGDAYTEELNKAWSGVYGFITSNMLKGANESLLRFSLPLYGSDHKQTMTLDQCVANLIPGQNHLFYITTAKSPNHGSFHKIKTLQEMGVTILLIGKTKREMIVTNLEKYLGRKMVDVDGDDVDLGFLNAGDASRNKARRSSPISVTNICDGLSMEEAEAFCGWFQAEMGTDKVVACTPTCSFASQPAWVIHHNGDDIAKTVRHLEDIDCVPLPKKHVEINSSHELIVEINEARYQNPEIARMLAEQIYDNCLINAGLMDGERSVVTRMNSIAMCLLKKTNCRK